MRKQLGALVALQIMIILAVVLFPAKITAQSFKSAKPALDSVMKYGVAIEPYLKKVTRQKIVPGFNYSPYINKFLKEHKYVKFPPYALTVGLDSTYASFKAHLVINSGNRLYFPAGSKLVCPPNMTTNGNMVYVDAKTSDVVISGIHLVGSKANPDYKTSQYGCGIALYAPTNVTIQGAKVAKSSGDGIAVRTHWGKQSENITIRNATITNATRAGMLITGIVNGRFQNITIEETGEKEKDKVVKPQVGLTFEPNDCTSKYVNCRFTNLNTKNNLGPVVSTANFVNLFINNTCGANKIDVVINGWKDVTNDPACYGATFDVATDNVKNVAPKYDTKLISGKFIVNNASFTRNKQKPDYFFFKGKDETVNEAVKYEINNLRLVSQGKKLPLKNNDLGARLKYITESSKKVSIR